MSAPSPGLPIARARTVVYIDGFNLYYGALKGTAYKWLDLERYFTLLRPGDDIQAIRYFTALVNGPRRGNQIAYLNALATLSLVDVVPGNFKRKRVLCNQSSCTYTGTRFFETLEEKRTDVNIAVAMLDDAYQEICDIFVLVSGDSDLVPSIKVIRARFPLKKIIVYVPHIPSPTSTRGHAMELRTAAHIHRDLPLNMLKVAQFPIEVPDGSGGTIRKPVDW